MATLLTSAQTQQWVRRLNVNDETRTRASSLNVGTNTTVVSGRWQQRSPVPLGGEITLQSYSNTGSLAWSRDLAMARGGTANLISSSGSSAGNVVALHRDESPLHMGMRFFGLSWYDSNGQLYRTNRFNDPSAWIDLTMVRMSPSSQATVIGYNANKIVVGQYAVSALWPLLNLGPEARRSRPNAAFHVTSPNLLLVVGESVPDVACPLEAQKHGYVTCIDRVSGSVQWEATYNRADMGDSAVDVTSDGTKAYVLFAATNAGGEKRAVTRAYDLNDGSVAWTDAFEFPGGTAIAPSRIVANSSLGVFCGGQATVNNLPRVVAWHYPGTGGNANWSTNIGFATGASNGQEKPIDFAVSSVDAHFAATLLNQIDLKHELRLGDISWTTGAIGPDTLYSPAGNTRLVQINSDVDPTGFRTLSNTQSNSSETFRLIRWDGALGQDWLGTPAPAARGKHDYFNAVVQEVEGFLYTTGSSNGAIITAKYAPDGTRQWLSVNDAGPNDTYSTILDGGYDLAVSNSGDVTVVGMSRGRGVVMKLASGTGTILWRRPMADVNFPHRSKKLLTLASDGDAIVARLQQGKAGTMRVESTNGSLVWNRSYTHPAGSARVAAIEMDSAGNVVIAGDSGTVSGCPAAPDRQVFAIKYQGTTGAQIWAKTYQGPVVGEARAADLYLDTANNPHVFASFEATAGHQAGLIKFGAGSGDLRSTRFYQPIGSNVEAVRIVRDNANNAFALASSTGSFYQTTEVWKWPANGGAASWSRQIDPNNMNLGRGEGESLLWDASGVYVAGSSYVSPTLKMSLTKLDPTAGTVTWVHLYGLTDGAARGMDVTLDPLSKDAFLVGGSSGTNSSMDGAILRITP